MAYRTVGRQATHLALLLGSTFFPVAVLAAGTESVAIQAPSVLPPALLLAKHWQAGLDPLGFLVSEKLDGVRAFWDGHVLRFRSGRRIAAPDWFTAALPATPLDGERAARVLSLADAAGVPWLQAVQQSRVPDRAMLQCQLLQLVSDGAEGLVLHRADADWTPAGLPRFASFLRVREAE